MRRILLIACTLAAGAGRAAEAGPYFAEVVMSGLSNPRGIAVGPDGGVYVTEAGSGGNGPSVTLGGGQVASLGSSGGVSRLRDGRQERVLSGLPSLASADGTEATGLQDIIFTPSGEAYGVIGLGGDPRLRSALGASGGAFGTLVRLDFAGRSFGVVADLAGHELATNPSGAPDSNPTSLAARPGGGFAVADAGANAVWGVSTDGTVGTLALLPDQANPLPFGPPFLEAVPTSVAFGPTGILHIGELTGFPFPGGGADVLILDSGSLTTGAGGFTTIIDLAFGPDGNLYVLELSRDLLAGPGLSSGVLTRVEPLTGRRTTILDEGLTLPTGLAIGGDGSIYVSNFGLSPGGGQVLRITAVPQPGSLTLLGLGTASLAAYGWRRRGR